jgi:restriction endonuclease-like protein
MLSARNRYVSHLRQELIARNSSYAALNLLPHVVSYGELPVVVYQQSECGRHHGNFISASYTAILKRPQWSKRLQKVHSQGRHSLPARDGLWRELDSSLSSDTLLMNIFCYPGVTRRKEVCRILGLDRGNLPEFGFMPRVPLLSEAIERTEIDMKLGNMLFEAKLTEGSFQIQRAELVERYRDFKEIFECRQLPRATRKYVSYQLIRNVLAAHALGLDFCTLLDARRPDLLQDWYNIVCCVRSATVRARCKVLTWQELTLCLPAALQRFLSLKYGITPVGYSIEQEHRPEQQDCIADG